jgi:hypothetical protein
VIVLTTGTGFVATGDCMGCGDWPSVKDTPHMLQNTASSALLLPQDGHRRIVET